MAFQLPPKTKLVRFECGGSVGSDPNAVAEIAYQLTKDGPELKLTAFTIRKDAIELEVVAETDLEASELGARAIESIKVGVHRGSMRGVEVRLRNARPSGH